SHCRSRCSASPAVQTPRRLLSLFSGSLPRAEWTRSLSRSRSRRRNRSRCGASLAHRPFVSMAATSNRAPPKERPRSSPVASTANRAESAVNPVSAGCGRHLEEPARQTMDGAVPISVALVAGGLAVINPCSFPLLPAFLSFYVGAEEAKLPRTATRVAQGLLVGA